MKKAARLEAITTGTRRKRIGRAVVSSLPLCRKPPKRSIKSTYLPTTLVFTSPWILPNAFQSFSPRTSARARFSARLTAPSPEQRKGAEAEGTPEPLLAVARLALARVFFLFFLCLSFFFFLFFSFFVFLLFVSYVFWSRVFFRASPGVEGTKGLGRGRVWGLQRLTKTGETNQVAHNGKQTCYLSRPASLWKSKGTTLSGGDPIGWKTPKTRKLTLDVSQTT